MIVKPSYLVGGTFNAVAPIMQDGDVGPLQFDTSGNLKVNVVIGGGGGSGSNAAAGPTGAPVPASAGYTGVNIGGTLFGVTGFNLTDSVPMAVAIVNANGDQITSFGGGTQYVTGTAVPTPTGTAALGWDGTDVRVLSTDSSGQLKVLIENTPAVTISGTVGVTQSTSPWVISFTAPQHVIVDSGSISVTQGTSPWVDDPIDRAARLLGIVYGSQSKQLTQTATNFNLQVELATGATLYDARQIRALTSADVVTVDQGTNPWVVSLTSTTITGNVNVVGTTTDGTTTETNFLVVGGETNDATAQYQPIPLGPAGRSVIIEGVVGGIAVPVSQSGLWNVNQAIGVAGFEKVTDGVNTAAVKAASTTPVAADPALVVAISPNTATLPVSFASQTILDVPITASLLGDNIVIPAPTGGKSIFVIAWNLSFSGTVNAKFVEPSSSGGSGLSLGLFDSQIPDSGIFDDEIPSRSIFDVDLSLGSGLFSSVLKAGVYFGVVNSGVGQSTSLPGFLWKDTANTPLSLNLSANIPVGGQISYYVA